MHKHMFLIFYFFSFNIVCFAVDFITPLPSPTHNPPVLHADDPRVCPRGHRRELEYRREEVFMSFEDLKEKYYDYTPNVSKISSVLDQTDKFICERFLSVDNANQINSAELKSLIPFVAQVPINIKTITSLELEEKNYLIKLDNLNNHRLNSEESSVDLLDKYVLNLPEKNLKNRINDCLFEKNNKLKVLEQNIEDDAVRIGVAAVNISVELTEYNQRINSEFVLLPFKSAKKAMFISNCSSDNSFYILCCPSSNAFLFAETILKKRVDVYNMTVDNAFQEYEYFLNDILGENIKNTIHYNEQVKRLMPIFKDMYIDIIKPIILVKLEEFRKKSTVTEKESIFK